MQQINLRSIQIPLAAATKTFAILAKRGAGKSYTGAVMAEEFYKNNIPFVVFDPIDVWWGLKLDKNGKDKGLPVVVFGLQHADIQIDRDMGRKIAQAVAKENVSVVISTFGMPKVAMRHLIAEFAEEILNINNTPRHIFIEEAHEFVPQRVQPGAGKTFAAVEALVTMGRNRGIGVTLINQRAATVNKDVLTQLDTLLAFQNTSPQDRQAMADWVEYHSADGDFNKFMKSLPSLEKGHGWIWSPEFLDVFEKIKIRTRETFHPDREKIGDNFVMPQLDSTDIQSFITSFQKTPVVKDKKIKSVKIPEKTTDQEVAEEVEKVTIQAVKNTYESKLIEKDSEIRRLQSVINAVQRAVGSTQTENVLMTSLRGATSSNLGMWLEKLGKGQPAKVLKFLSEHPADGFTLNQIALAVGTTRTNLGSNIMYKLRRNLLVIDEGDRVRINPDL